ncbi:FxSxx-COOH system tetratricopeptide repeat protein [Micromonospora sp. CPCC 206061]|uniref:FxSxx-COOH system tetratricopeptide repeat protein n=1 Tax=Micromonospora sp. CPCC 206061 TaxID=3122410 RepID=UPI002FF0054A
MSGSTGPVDEPRSERSVRIVGSYGVQIGDHNTQTNVFAPDRSLVPPPDAVVPPAGTHNLPAPAAVFVGRDLEALDQLLSRGHGAIGQVVHGLGGIGKTELAIHYARRYAHRYTFVWWITADTPERVTLGLADLTTRLHPMPNLAQATTWAIGWLQSHPGWLLVLDNVEDPADVGDLFGALHGRGHILVTTRRDLGDARWARLSLATLHLGVLDRAASVQLLTRLTRRTDEAAFQLLAADLGDLPLALEQAAAYITQHQVTPADYRALLARHPARMYDAAGEGGNQDRTVRRVWTVTMNAVAARSTLAARLLRVLAYLAPEELPDDVLVPLADEPLDVSEALALLASYSMVTRASGSVSVHRLVQAITRTADTTDLAPRSAEPPVVEQALRLIRDALPGDVWRDVAGWPRWNLLLPHINAIVAHLPPEHRTSDLPYVLDLTGAYLQVQGQLVQGTAYLADALVRYEAHLGADHPDVVASRNNLATAYESLGRLGDAIPLYEQSLDTSERLFGDDDPTTLVVRNNLASAYRSAGRVAASVALFEQVVDRNEQLRGEEHPDTLTSRNNLAYGYRSMGRVADAIPLFERNLRDRERILGPKHPDTLTSRGNLAGAYEAIGRLAEAISLYERAATERRDVLGSEHPHTLAAASNLACVYLSAGEADRALAVLEDNHVQRERVSGPDHPDTIACRNNLANAYLAKGRLGDALALYEQNAERCPQVLGAEHPYSLTARNNLAYAYRSIGRIDEAVAMFERNLADRRRVLDAAHPDTLTARNNLASAYRLAGRIDEAAAMFEDVLADRRRLLGDEHPDTLVSATNLGSAYRALGRVDDAIATLEQNSDRCRRVLGPAHPATLTCLNNLALGYAWADRRDDAVALLLQTRSDGEERWGVDHPLTAMATANLAAIRPA